MEFLLDQNIESVQELGPSIFVDGRCKGFLPERDLELSHWIPNSTPEQFKADTSTEICLKYLNSKPNLKEYNFVVNNHLDTDGLCSVFTLVEPELALENQTLLTELSKMGDFGFPGSRQTSLLFHSLYLKLKEVKSEKTDLQEQYLVMIAFLRDELVSKKYLSNKEAQKAWDDLNSYEKELHQLIKVITVHSRLRFYIFPEIPRDLNWKIAFDNGLHVQSILPAQIRNQWHPESTILAFLPIQDQWKALLLMPQYIWAQTPGLYRPSFLKPTQDTNSHEIDEQFFKRFLNQVNRLESSKNQWRLATTVNPFSKQLGLPFPWFGGCLDKTAQELGCSNLQADTILELAKEYLPPEPLW